LRQTTRWGVGEVQRGMRLGLRAVGLENRPTCAAHLAIGRRRRSFFWAAQVERFSETPPPGDPFSWLEALPPYGTEFDDLESSLLGKVQAFLQGLTRAAPALGGNMRAPCAHVFPATLLG